MFGSEITFDEAIFITIFSILTVFVVLACLVFLIQLTAKVMNRKKEEKTEEVTESTQEVQDSSATLISSEAEDEDMAPISVLLTAAVAAHRSNDKASADFVVRKFRQVTNNETPWILASRNMK